MKDIISALNLAQSLARQIDAKEVSAIERDLALEKLRNIYDLLLGVTAAAEEQEPLAESVIELIEELVDEVEEFDNSEEEVAEVAEPEPEPEPEQEPEQEPEIEVRPKTKLAHSAILALYDDEEEETEEEVAPAEEEGVVEEEVVAEEEPEKVVIDMTEPIVEVEPEEVAEGAEPAAAEAEEEEEQPVKVVLGEVLGADQTTLADRIAADAPADVASVANAQKSLVEMIGLNDKFILLRDLFHNNHDYYEAAIDQLDEFEDIDEAMLFIHDNFQWNPNSEGAKLLVEMLSNKLL